MKEVMYEQAIESSAKKRFSIGQRLVKNLTLETRSAPVILLAPIFIFLIAVTLFPLLYAIYTSSQYYVLSDPLGKDFVGLDNYIYMMKDVRFWNALATTFQFVFFSLLCEVGLGFIMAMLFAKNYRGSGVAKTLFLLPMITTPVVVALIWVMLLDPQFGLINYLFGLIGISPQAWLSQEHAAIWVIIGVDVWEWTPFIALVLLSGLKSLPSEPFEAAQVDGATKWQTFYHLTLPMMTNYIVIAVVFRFMDVFRWFDTIYVMTKGGPGTATETINMYGYLTGFNFLNMGYAAALGIAMLIIITIISQTIIKRTTKKRRGSITNANQIE